MAPLRVMFSPIVTLVGDAVREMELRSFPIPRFTMLDAKTSTKAHSKTMSRVVDRLLTFSLSARFYPSC